MNYIQKSLLSVLSCTTLLFLTPSEGIARRAGIAIDARNLAEQAIQTAMHAENKGAIDAMQQAERMLEIRESMNRPENSHNQGAHLEEIIATQEALNAQASIDKSTKVSQEALELMQNILNGIRNREKLSFDDFARTTEYLKEGVIQDLADSLHKLVVENALTEELRQQLVSEFIQFAKTESVGWQIKHADQATVNQEHGYIELGEFYFDYLTPMELVQLLNILQVLSDSKDGILTPFIFDIKDKLVRLAYEDNSLIDILLKKVSDSTEHNRHLKAMLQSLQGDRFEFNPLMDVSGGSFEHIDTATFVEKNKPESRKSDNEKIVVFQAAYEAPNFKIGGLGAFMTDFTAELSKQGDIDLRLISQYFDFLKNLHPCATFKGFIDHEVYGQPMRSSVYMIEINEGIKQYLIKPDSKMARIFDIGRAKNVYKAFRHAEYNPKMCYFNSALATLAATYQGENGNDSVDILHLHSWHTALAAALMDLKLNPLREKSGIAPVKLLNTVHMHGPEQGIMNAKIYNYVGLDLPEGRQRAVELLRNNIYESPGYDRLDRDFYADLQGYDENRSLHIGEDFYGENQGGYDETPRGILGLDAYGNAYEENIEIINQYGESLEVINLLLETAKHVDYINTVSPSLAEDMQNPNFAYGVHDLFGDLAEHGQFTGILNGMNTDKFDPKSESVLGSFAVSSDLSDLDSRKQEAKRALFEAGIISDPNKPLFLYVGRFSNEKGIDYLPKMAQQIAANGGQMLVMGMTPYTMPYSIEMLMGMQAFMPVRVLTELKDQLALFGNSGAKTGMIARFAADYTVIPSKMESCGLVALEALCMGSFLATSYTQGLKSICTPFDNDFTSYDAENCSKYDYIFDSDEQTDSNISVMIDRCFEILDQLTDSERSEVQKSIIEHSKSFNWKSEDTENGSIHKYLDIYHSLIQE